MVKLEELTVDGRLGAYNGATPGERDSGFPERTEAGAILDVERGSLMDIEKVYSTISDGSPLENYPIGICPWWRSHLEQTWYKFLSSTGEVDGSGIIHIGQNA
ncbi:MAG: hypothetical protein LBB24_01170 [Rickettsiales bacterium]|nr:hypothetical protein [Rickettsiales bacterium]